MHLPVFAAAAGGLFAEEDLDVELVNSQGSTTERLAAGEAEFGLTATLYFLRSQAARQPRLPVRFVLPLHQRDPMAALVRDDADMATVEDLAGRSAARWGLAWMADAYTAALARRGLAAPEIVAVEGDPSAALRTRDVEVVPSWAETIPVRSYADVRVRAIPFDLDGYASGLVAADDVDDEVVARMCRALDAGFALQQAQPDPGLTAFCDHYSEVPRSDASDNWRRFLPFAEVARPRTVDPARWAATVAGIQAAHGLGPLDAAELARIPEPTGTMSAPPEAGFPRGATAIAESLRRE